MLIWVTFGYLMQLFVNIFLKKYFFKSYRMFFYGLVKIFGIKVNISGRPATKKTLIICNHISYLDILILGSKVNAIFVAKSEISNWPIINKLTAVGKTIFVRRKSRSDVKNQMQKIEKNLRDNFNVILFPEGTSSDGLQVLPFKSSLFGIIENPRMKNFMIQSVSITYNKLDGVPVDLKYRPFLAWFGGMDLFSHAWKFLGLGTSEVQLNFQKPVKFSSFANRKIASESCFNQISNQVNRNNMTKKVNKILKLNEFKIL